MFYLYNKQYFKCDYRCNSYMKINFANPQIAILAVGVFVIGNICAANKSVTLGQLLNFIETLKTLNFNMDICFIPISIILSFVSTHIYMISIIDY